MLSYNPKSVEKCIEFVTDLSASAIFLLFQHMISPHQDAWIIWNCKSDQLQVLGYPVKINPDWNLYPDYIPLFSYSLYSFYGFRIEFNSFKMDWDEQKNACLKLLRMM